MSLLRKADDPVRVAVGCVTLLGSIARRAASSVVEHLTFNQGVPGSIPGRPTSSLRVFHPGASRQLEPPRDVSEPWIVAHAFEAGERARHEYEGGVAFVTGFLDEFHRAILLAHH